MTAVIAAFVAAGLAGGALLIVAGLQSVPVRSGRPYPQTLQRMRRALQTRLSRRDRILAVVGLAVGMVAALLTGWVIAIPMLPLALVGLPKLLAADPEVARSLSRLEGMQEWTRSLASVLSVGQSLEQAVRSTLRSAPTAIRPEVAALVARLNARWDSAAALRAFADELDDPTGDLIAAALIVGSRTREEARLAQVLNALAASVQDDVHARRTIEADRDRPRGSIRAITVISVVVMAAATLSGQFAAYGTPFGQVLLAAYLAGFVAVLLWMRRLTRSVKVARFMTATVQDAS